MNIHTTTQVHILHQNLAIFIPHLAEDTLERNLQFPPVVLRLALGHAGHRQREALLAPEDVPAQPAVLGDALVNVHLEAAKHDR